MSLEKYPIDFDAIEKPSWIEGDQLERAVGFKPADGARWQFGLMKLSKLIERHTGFGCRIDKDRIRVCDDAEWDEYTTAQNERGQNLIVSSFARRALIDRSRLTEDQRAIAERRDRYLGGLTQAVRSEARRLRRIEGLIQRPNLLDCSGEAD